LISWNNQSDKYRSVAILPKEMTTPSWTFRDIRVVK